MKCLVSALTARTRLSKVILLGLAMGSVAPALAESKACAPAASSEKDIIAVFQNIFAALQADDLKAYQNLVSPKFYAFSGGARYDAVGFMNAVKEAHAAGLRFEWSVTKPDVHVMCNQAWATYYNVGSIDFGNGKGKVPKTWLDSMYLEYQNGRWHVDFLHGTQVPDADSPGEGHH